ncbi:hypothetical protein [Halosimplex salinum]|uniref:hypothetical protein n=1 Tax=Halosimplex salinum TaxID=1710538 RepID=UPI000F473B12|nr:hypothetical protein [Halosimplex salinum]
MDRHGNAMLSRALVVFIVGAGIVDWGAVVDTDEVFVVARMFVTTNADLSAFSDEREFEGFVLGSLGDTTRKIQLVE